MKNVESTEVTATLTESDSTTVLPIVPVVKTEEAAPKLEEDPDDEIVGKKFYFNIYRGDNTEAVQGDVNVIDTEKARKIGTYVGNKRVKITKPPGKSGNISLICEVFGYRKVQRDINYNTPQGDDIRMNEDSATVVPFELVRLQKGDYAIMYHVYFFNDAAIMRPESRYEVNSLLTMLQENPKYRIRLHGHTNGNHHGPMTLLADGNKNYFALNDTKTVPGTAKKLSGERAQLIKAFLVDGGIESSRMEVKAWGGKKAIYDKHSPQAQSNVRVEIEILEN
jgi:outer membrane protein OmpA-like peptidoglycan-associated protein